VGAGAMWNVAGAGLLAAWARRAQWPVGIEIRLIERFAAVTESIGWSILPRVRLSVPLILPVEKKKHNCPPTLFGHLVNRVTQKRGPRGRPTRTGMCM
jgi:hypothetical protein